MCMRAGYETDVLTEFRPFFTLSCHLVRSGNMPLHAVPKRRSLLSLREEGDLSARTSRIPAYATARATLLMRHAIFSVLGPRLGPLIPRRRILPPRAQLSWKP